MDDQWLFMEEQREWGQEMESTLSERGSVEMTAGNVHQDIISAESALAGFETADSNSEKDWTAGQMLPHSSTCFSEFCQEKELLSIHAADRHCCWLL